jgi:hypothetical protein
MDERKHRRVGADPKRQREHCYGCEPSIFSKHPECIAPVLGKCVDPRQATLSPILLFHLFEPTEVAAGRPTGLVDGQPSSNVVFGKGIKMCLNFVGELGVSPLLRKESDDA